MGLLDDLDGNIEEEKQLSDKKDKAFQGMIDRITEEYVKFERWLTDAYKNNNYISYESDELIEKKLYFYITPKAIEYFLQDYTKYKNQESELWINEFSTVLIQNCYDQGHNNFNFPVLLDGKGKLLEEGYSFLCGKKENPIDITLQGNFPHHYCYSLKHVNVKFTKTTDIFCATECLNSKIIFEGDAGAYSGYKSKDCDIYFHGSINEKCGFLSENSRFYSPHIINLKQINKVAASGCSFYLIEKDESHKEVTFK